MDNPGLEGQSILATVATHTPLNSRFGTSLSWACTLMETKNIINGIMNSNLFNMVSGLTEKIKYILHFYCININLTFLQRYGFITHKP